MNFFNEKKKNMEFFHEITELYFMYTERYGMVLSRTELNKIWFTNRCLLIGRLRNSY